MMSSLTWTRTKNLPINSRLLCQLSYQGLTGLRAAILARTRHTAKSAMALYGAYKSPTARSFWARRWASLATRAPKISL